MATDFARLEAGAGALARAELMHELAAAFLPPHAESTTREWCSSLAADLSDLAPALGMNVDAACSVLHGCAAGEGGDEPWLVRYSRLFLVPPVAVPLNAGIYLDGTIAGPAAQMMQQTYAALGYAPRESFHDLPDHAAMQVEFLGALLERAAQGDAGAAAMAEEFVDDFVSHWLEPMRRALEKGEARDGAARPYGALLDVLQEALA